MRQPSPRIFALLTCGCYLIAIVARRTPYKGERSLISDVPRLKLSELMTRFGIGLGEDARRCKALLADICGIHFRGECAVLVAAVEEGVPAELVRDGSGLPKDVLLDRLSHSLQTDRGVSPDLARWSVETWALALRVMAPDEVPTSFRMDGLKQLIDFAGADGVISAIELNHLLKEAEACGVKESDANAFISEYAAAREWRVDKPLDRASGTFGKLLKSYVDQHVQQRRGWTQQDFANALKISPRTLNSWLIDRTLPRSRMLTLLGRVLFDGRSTEGYRELLAAHRRAKDHTAVDVFVERASDPIVVAIVTKLVNEIERQASGLKLKILETTLDSVRVKVIDNHQRRIKEIKRDTEILRVRLQAATKQIGEFRSILVAKEEEIERYIVRAARGANYADREVHASILYLDIAGW